MSHASSDTFTLQHDPWGQLVLIDAEGQRHVGVVPVRAFPISQPEAWISICDAAGHELACVEDVAALPAAVRAVLEEDLARREFVPELLHIKSVSSILEPCEWRVETDRGETAFVLKDDDDIRRLGPHSALVVDAQGMRYLIRDARSLDAASRRIIERYL